VPARVVLFAREPEAGRVKSRLAAALGPDEAASLYRAFLEDLSAELGLLRLSLEVRYTPDLPPRLLPRIFPPPWRFVPQGRDDLGSRLARAAENALAEGGPVVICGTDAPLLQTRHIEEALRALVTHAVVLSPARDGGFSLVGLRRPARPGALFDGIPWSTAHTRRRLEERSSELSLPCRSLEPLDDVDELADLDHLARCLESAPSSAAPRTRMWLASRRSP